MESLDALREMVGSLPSEAPERSVGAHSDRRERAASLPEFVTSGAVSLGMLHDSTGAALCYGSVDWGHGQQVGRIDVTKWVGSAHIPRAAAHIRVMGRSDSEDGFQGSTPKAPVSVAIEVLCYQDVEVLFVLNVQGMDAAGTAWRYPEDVGSQSQE